MRIRFTALLTPLILLGMLGFATAVRAELPIVTGKEWMASDNDTKLAFLLGLATMIKVEQNLLGDPPPPGTRSFAPALAKGLAGMSLTEVMQRIDSIYADHPGRRKKSVIGVIWRDIAIPRLEAEK